LQDFYSARGVRYDVGFGVLEYVLCSILVSMIGMQPLLAQLQRRSHAKHTATNAAKLYAVLQGERKYMAEQNLLSIV
jgi:hypothetical protein